MEKLIRSFCNEKAECAENEPKEGEIKKYFNLSCKIPLFSLLPTKNSL